MKQIGDMKLYTLDEVVDEMIEKKGNPERDEFDRKVDESVHAYQIGEAIRNARIQKNLTQEELGKRVGVQKSQISRIEKGHSISIPTMSKVFKALGIQSATLDLGTFGKVALW